MRYVTSVERIGIRKGKKEGKKEGRKEGKAALLKKLLLHQFSEIPSWVEKLLNDASPDDLDRWSIRVLDATSLEDVFATA